MPATSAPSVSGFSRSLDDISLQIFLVLNGSWEEAEKYERDLASELLDRTGHEATVDFEKNNEEVEVEVTIFIQK